MVDERSYERGRDKLREVHGERALATVESLGDLGRLIVDVAYGEEERSWRLHFSVGFVF